MDGMASALGSTTSRRAVWAALDDITEEAADLAGIFSAWPRLQALARRVLAQQGDAGRVWLRAHPVAELAQQDPLTAWSFRKPRGYTGDARLLDYVYGHPVVADSLAAASARGRDIHAFNHCEAASEALRDRRALLARLVDDTVEATDGAAILTLGAGHLREAELAENAPDVGRWVALEADQESLDELAEAQAERIPGLEPVNSTPQRLILQPLHYGRFDLVYAAGLLEALEDRAAERMIGAMFQAVKPGGRMLVSNLVHELRAEGYMDAFMDWRMVTRAEPELATLLHPLEGVAKQRLFRSANGAMVHALVTKAHDP